MFSLPKLMVFGAQGQVGYELIGLAQEEGFEVLAPPSEVLDIRDADAVRTALELHRPDYVINAAGMTDLEKSEQDPQLCYAINRDAAGHLAEGCERIGAVLVHLTTSYVFDGRKGRAYVETDHAEPQSVYALSKWQGESLVAERVERHLILRTSWIYSGRPDRWLRRLLKEARQITDIEVDDQHIANPTSAADLARVIVAIIKQLDCGAQSWGVYHYAGSDSATCYGFAEAVVAAARQYEELCLERLKPRGTLVEADAALRPPRLLLDCRKIRGTFGIMRHPWRTELMKVIRQLYTQSQD